MIHIYYYDHIFYSGCFLLLFFLECKRGRRDRDCMVVGFTTICAINAQSSK